MRTLLSLLFTVGAWTQALPLGGIPIGGGGSVTYSLVQHVKWGGSSPYIGCSGATCNVVITQPTAGNLLVFLAFGFAGSGSITPAAPTSTPSAGTWVECQSTRKSALNGASSAFVMAGCYYSLSAASSGPTTITWNWSGSTTGTVVDLIEINRSSGTWTYDTSNSTTDTSCTSCTGQALTLSGTDYVIQFAGGIATSSHNLSALGSPYTSFSDIGNYGATYVGAGVAGANGVTNGAAPTWTLAVGDVLPVGAVAFK